MTRSRLIVGVGGMVAVVGVLAWLGTQGLQRRAERIRTQVMADSLRELRSAVDDCRTRMLGEEADFLEFNASVDSLRARVRAMEEMDERGVPGESYPEYLELFDRYNASVEDWQSRADELEAFEEACTRLTIRHNSLADSLRARIEAPAP